MRKTLRRYATTGLAALAFSVTLQAGTVADLDRDNGLPEAKLGTPLESFKGLQLVEDTGRWLTYKAPGEKHAFSGFTVTGIKYNFFKGKLYSMNVAVDGKRSTKGILKALETSYGTTHTFEKKRLYKADTDLETREWAGARVYLLYKSAENGRGGELTLIDKPTWDQMEVPREQRRETFRQMLGGSFANGDF